MLGALRHAIDGGAWTESKELHRASRLISSGASARSNTAISSRRPSQFDWLSQRPPKNLPGRSLIYLPDTVRDSPVDAPPLAVILAAGEGSRLACQRDGTPKPALKLLGLSLAERTITSCMAAGIQRFLVVLGHAAEQVQAHYQGIGACRQCEVEFVTAQDWKLGNGASALAAADAEGSHVGFRGPTFSDTIPACRA